MAAPPPGYPVPENKGVAPYPPQQPAYGSPYAAPYPPQPAYDAHAYPYGAGPQQFGQHGGHPQPSGYPAPMNVQQMPPGAYSAGPYQAPGQMVMSQQQAQPAGAAGPCCACCAGLFACCAACCIVDTCCDLLFGDW